MVPPLFTSLSEVNGHQLRNMIINVILAFKSIEASRKVIKSTNNNYRGRGFDISVNEDDESRPTFLSRMVAPKIKSHLKAYLRRILAEDCQSQLLFPRLNQPIIQGEVSFDRYKAIQ